MAGTYREATTRSRTYEPDLSRFLAASEPQEGDDEPERRPRRGARRSAPAASASTTSSAASAASAASASTSSEATDTASRPPTEAEPRPAAAAPEKSGPSAASRVLARIWGFRRSFLRIVLVVVIVGGAGLLLRQFVVAPYYIPSASMEPTLHGCDGCNDDRILVDKISYRLHDPKVKDVVVFDRPAGVTVEDDVLVKRVIGIGGDRVSLRNGLVYLNGGRLDEPYLNPKCNGRKTSRPTQPLTRTSSWTVPKDELFVMGDNRCDSTDSRVFGPIKVSSVIGRAWLIFWPLSRFGTID